MLSNLCPRIIKQSVLMSVFCERILTVLTIIAVLLLNLNNKIDALENNSSNASTANDIKKKLLDGNKTDSMIPMDFYRQLNNITDISEFIEKFIDPNSIDPKIGLQENLKRTVERASVVRAKAANCIPENTVVDLLPLNPANNYFPRCTRVKRCGGCCSTMWMTCKPLETEVVNFQVYRYCYDEEVKFCGLDIIPVEQHLSCKCECRMKPEDCNAYQKYQDCKCHCINNDAHAKCLQLENKTWDDINCRCVCKQNDNCTTGSYFDENLCKCMLPHDSEDAFDGTLQADNPIKGFDRRRFYIKPKVVETDNSTLYEV